jgi:hypothetical protein
MQLKPLLERLPIFIAGGVFNGDGVVTLTDFAALLHFAFPLLLYIFELWGRRIGDILCNVILQTTTRVSVTTPGKSVL